jgi:hypothetical protein
MMHEIDAKFWIGGWTWCRSWDNADGSQSVLWWVRCLLWETNY